MLNAGAIHLLRSIVGWVCAAAACVSVLYALAAGLLLTMEFNIRSFAGVVGAAALSFGGWMLLDRSYLRYETDYIRRALMRPEKVLATVARRTYSEGRAYTLEAARVLMRSGIGPYAPGTADRVERSWGAGVRHLILQELLLPESAHVESAWNWELVLREFPMPAWWRLTSDPDEISLDDPTGLYVA
jgi:hypothetical protein